MPTKLGRKPMNERVYITGSVGLLTMLILFFIPVFPTTTYIVIPGETRTVNTNDINPGTLAPNQILEVRGPDRATNLDSRRSLFDTLYYQSSFRSVNLKQPVLSWAFYLLVSLATTGVTWFVVAVIYKRIEEPFAK